MCKVAHSNFFHWTANTKLLPKDEKNGTKSKQLNFHSQMSVRFHPKDVSLQIDSFQIYFKTPFSSKKFDYLKIPTEQIITFKNEFISPLYP